MSALIRVSGLLLLSGFLLLSAGCGGGNSTHFAAAPTGSFTNASLAGTYAFNLTGTNQGGFLAVAGSLQADGNGHITSGVEDVNSATGVFLNVPLTGSYSIGADGRGTAFLNSSAAGITLDFVLITNQHGLISRFDPNSSASGTIDLQNASAFSAAALQGQFAFNVAGIDLNGSSLASAGTFMSDGVGILSNGLQDINDNGGIQASLPATGVYSVGANGRGTMTLTSSAGSFDFAFYVVDGNHLKLIQTDSAPVLAGDVFRQQGPFSNRSLTGGNAFTVAGGTTGPFAAGGILAADGNGNVTSGVVDVNNRGSIAQNLAVTGNYSIATNGRGTLSLNSSAGISTFVIYPSTGGLQMLQTDAAAVASGVAFAQSVTAFSNASLQGNYGFNLSGSLNNVGPVDAIASLSADGNGGLSGTIDFNISGSLVQGLTLSGNYSLAGNGHGAAAVRSSNGTQNLTLYSVSGTRVLFIEVDSNAVAVGEIDRQ